MSRKRQIVAAAGALGRWLLRRPGYLLLVADRRDLRSASTDGFERAWIELLVISLAWGAASVGLWSASRKLFGDQTGILFMPVAAVVAVFVLWPFRQSVISLAEVFSGPRGSSRSVVIAVQVAFLALCLLSLKWHHPYQWHHSPEAPSVLAWLRPDLRAYRILLLMPLWGAWSMMMLCQFTRPGPSSEAHVRRFADGCGAVASAVVMGALLATALLYLPALTIWQKAAMLGGTVGGSIVAGLIVCQLSGGLSRRSLLASNLIAQQIWLLAAMANVN